MSNPAPTGYARHPSAPMRFAYRMLKKPFFGRFEKPWRWPSGTESTAFERFDVEGQSGERLHGLVLSAKAEGEPRGVLLLAHPMGLAAKGFFMKYGHAEAFSRAGYHCVLFDFNGFGESASVSFDYPEDLLAVARWVRTRFPGLAMGVVGASFGAMRALEAAADPSCPFDVVVAEAAAPSLEEFWRTYAAPYAVLRLMKAVAPGAERRVRPEAMIRLYPPGRKVLLVHSHADRFTPPAHGDAIAAAAPAHVTVERLVVDGSEHTHTFRDDRERYLETVLDFLGRHLPEGA